MFRPLLGFIFNVLTGKYFEQSGRAINEDEILSIMEDRIREAQRRLESFFRAFIRGSIEADDFRIYASSELRNLYFQLAMLGSGGKNLISEKQINTVIGLLLEQYDYLEGLVLAIEAQEVSERQAISRLALYANAGRRAFWTMETELMSEAGFSEERRVLSPVENCASCTALAALDWQPIGSLPEPCDGSTECLTNCQCLKQYR